MTGTFGYPETALEVYGPEKYTPGRKTRRGERSPHTTHFKQSPARDENTSRKHHLFRPLPYYLPDNLGRGPHDEAVLAGVDLLLQLRERLAGKGHLVGEDGVAAVDLEDDVVHHDAGAGGLSGCEVGVGALDGAWGCEYTLVCGGVGG